MTYLTTQEAAERLSTTPAYVRVLIERKQLKSVKRGRDHMISQTELSRYIKSKLKKGK